MKIIKLSQGKVALIDDEDFERVNLHKWYVHRDKRNNGNYYAVRLDHKTRTMIRLQRVIMDIAPLNKLKVDHKNGDSLDNRRFNLRLCNDSQNGCNRGKTKANTSGFKGVFKNPFGNWYSRMENLQFVIFNQRKWQIL